MNVAQVPVVYHVPAVIKQPSWLPLVIAFRYPVPENAPPVEVGAAPDVVLVTMVVVTEPPDLGRYLIPVEAQDADWPTGAAGMKVPVWMEPLTSNEYQISSSAPDEHWMVTS